MKLIKHIILAGALALPISSVFSRELVLHTPSTNVSTFANGILSQLKGKTVGFAYVIAKNGRLAKQGQGGLMCQHFSGHKVTQLSAEFRNLRVTYSH